MYYSDLKPEDFDVMAYNPLKTPKGKFFINEHKAFNPQRNKDVFGLLIESEKSASNKYEKEFLVSLELLDKLMIFVVLFLDDKSPFYEETDFDERKNSVMLYLKYTSGAKGKDLDAYKLIKDYKSPVLEELTIFYFKKLFNYDFERWFSLKVLFHNNTQYLRSDFQPNTNGDVRADAQSKMAIAKDIDALQSQLEELELKIFKDDKLKAKLLEKAMDDSYAGEVEKRAENNPFL